MREEERDEVVIGKSFQSSAMYLLGGANKAW